MQLKKMTNNKCPNCERLLLIAELSKGKCRKCGGKLPHIDYTTWTNHIGLVPMGKGEV